MIKEIKTPKINLKGRIDAIHLNNAIRSEYSLLSFFLTSKCISLLFRNMPLEAAELVLRNKGKAIYITIEFLDEKKDIILENERIEGRT